MNNRELSHCLSDQVINQLLNDQLTSAESKAVESHLGECIACQRKMESRVSNEIGWIDLKTQLAEMEFSHELPASEADRQAIDGPAFIRDLPVRLAPTDDPAMLGRLGRYEICGVIGQGSMGIVFKAWDPRLNRFVAIKMLSNGYSNTVGSRERFEREARAIAAVRDPHVIEIYGVEEFRGVPYIVMRYVPGGSLQQGLDRNGPMEAEGVCRVGMQIAKGLAAAHRQGIVHRDIKPANILLEDGSQIAIVSDFGLARVGDEVTMTRTGAIAGTPQFMSPEQAKGQPLDVRTDLFSLGAVLYSLCTGHSPFRGETLMGVVHNVCETNPRPIREFNPEIPDWLEAFVLKLLSKDRNNRIQTASKVVTVLESELSRLHSPANLSLPERDWWDDKRRLSNWSRRLNFRSKLIVGAAIGLGIVVALICMLDFGNSTNNRWGIEPTIQELSLIPAKSAYELAHETHLAEVALRGDMAQSIARHKEAFEMGFDPPQTAFNLARAYAYEGKTEKALLWLERAIRCGFHNRQAITNEVELSKLRQESRYTLLLERVVDLERRFREGDQAYFAETNYAKAEMIFRALLADCPDDEFCKMMIGASLLEQGKFAEAKPWCEKTRKSIRFANFGNYNLGCIAAQNEDFDLAFSFLNHAVDTGFTDVQHLLADHHLKSIHEMPQFELLVNRMRESGGGR